MIGVFDSGHGGLTVLRALSARLPDRAFVYLGDHGHAPYGERSTEEIYALTRSGVAQLFEVGCRLVVLACNTASAIALRRLQQDWLPHDHPWHRVLGVFVPMVEAVTRVPWEVQGPNPASPREPAVVAVFATRRTVESGAYAREIALRAPALKVVEQACPGLVALLEAGAPAEAVDAAVAGHVAALMTRLDGQAPNSVILGCTHYPLVAAAFVAALPPGVPLFAQPDLAAASLAVYLRRHPEYDTPRGVPLRCLTSGDPAAVAALAGRFFGAPLSFERVSAIPRLPTRAACAGG